LPYQICICRLRFQLLTNKIPIISTATHIFRKIIEPASTNIPIYIAGIGINYSIFCRLELKVVQFPADKLLNDILQLAVKPNNFEKNALVMTGLKRINCNSFYDRRLR